MTLTMALPTWRGRTYSQGSLHLNLIFFPSPKRLQLGFITIFGCPFKRRKTGTCTSYQQVFKDIDYGQSSRSDWLGLENLEKQIYLSLNCTQVAGLNVRSDPTPKLHTCTWRKPALPQIIMHQQHRSTSSALLDVPTGPTHSQIFSATRT